LQPYFSNRKVLLHLLANPLVFALIRLPPLSRFYFPFSFPQAYVSGYMLRRLAGKIWVIISEKNQLKIRFEQDGAYFAFSAGKT